VRASSPKFAPSGALLSWDWVLGLLGGSRNAWLATTSADGRPHTAPLWIVVVHGAIWFSTPDSTTKGRNLARDARVALHAEAGDDVAIIEGHAVQRPAPDVAAAYAEKYHWPDPDPRSFWMVEVESALAWRGHLGPVQIDATRFDSVK
jgi:hypothetical protein